VHSFPNQFYSNQPAKYLSFIFQKENLLIM